MKTEGLAQQVGFMASSEKIQARNSEKCGFRA